VDRGLTVKQKTRTISNDLESLRENLLSLSDNIWLDIDHNDSEALREGAEFKLAYNEKMAEFGKADGNDGFLPQRTQRPQRDDEQAGGALD
jgi:hypothetical protein